MNYQCIFIKYLWKDASEKRKRLFSTLEREVSLPFLPQWGLEITEGKWFSGSIERIVWDNQGEIFTIKVKDIIPKDGVSAEMLLEIAIKQGWTSKTPS